MPAQEHIAEPLDLATPGRLTGSLRVTAGPPVDVLPMTAANYARFKEGDQFATLGYCSAYDQSELDVDGPGCLLDAGGYVLVLLNGDLDRRGQDLEAAPLADAVVDFSFRTDEAEAT